MPDCQNCGDYFSGDGGYDYCDDCEEYEEDYDNEGDDMPIRSGNPSLIMKGSNPLKFGFELEVESGRSDRQVTAQDLMEDMGGQPNDYLWVKSDPSINDGFEIASHPFDFAWWQANHESFAPIFRLPSKGVRSQQTRTCGLHIHMDRRGFKDTQHLYKFMKFIYDNPAFSKKMAGRKQSEMDQWGSLSKPQDEPECRCNCPTCEGRRRVKDGLLSKAELQSSGPRYTAVNTQGRNTIEVRMFKGTLNKCHFYANLEYLHATHQFTKGNRAIGNLNLKPFKEFAMKHNEDYPNLLTFMETKGL